MNAKLVGIGLLSLGCVAAAAAGGYLAMKQDRPLPTVVEAVPVPASVPDITAAPKAPADPTPTNPTPATSAVRVEAKPAPKPVRSTSPVPQAATASIQPTPAPTPASPTPTAAEPPPPPATSPTATPSPVATEPPRYVPDSPVQTATTPADPPRLEFEDLTVARHSVIGIRLDDAISTLTARVEDRVSATVSRDVTVDGRTAIAAGVRLEGTVVLVERGGRFRTRPRLGLEFDRMVLADGTRVNIKTDTIYRDGDSPSADATARVGAGAVAGAILGAVLGGKKGAAVGTAAGAAGGAATVMRGDPNESSLAAGAPLTVRLKEDVTVTISRQS